MDLASNYYATCASRLTTRALDCPGEAMRRQQFAPAARRPRVGGIAAVLAVLVTLAAEDRTQAQNAPRVSRILPGASVLNPSKLAGSEENLRGLGYVGGRNIGENSAGKISSAGGSGGRRCEIDQTWPRLRQGPFVIGSGLGRFIFAFYFWSPEYVEHNQQQKPGLTP